MTQRSILSAMLVALAACSTTGGPRVAQTRNVITAEEVASVNVGTAYEVIEQLRPQFFQSRGPSSIRSNTPATPIVYVNGVRYGEIESLTSIRAMDVEEIRLLSASDATTRYGTGHVGGVIEVRTKS